MSGSSPEAALPKAKKKPDIALICAACGALFSLLIFLFMLKQERDVAAQRLQLQMSDIAARIEQRWVSHLQNLESLQAYSVLVERIEAQALSHVIANLFRPNTAVEAVLWRPVSGELQQFDVDRSQPTAIDKAKVLAHKPDIASKHFWFASQSENEELHLVAGARTQQNGDLILLLNFAALLREAKVEVPQEVTLTLLEKATGDILFQQATLADAPAIEVEYDLNETQPWQLRFGASSEYIAQHTSFTPALFLLTGLLFSFLFAAYIKRIKLHLQLLRKEQETLSQQLLETTANDLETGIASKTHFDEVLDVECRRAVREFSPLTVMLIELDEFTAFRQHYGVEHADQALRQVASLLIESVGRPGDMVARINENRFALMLPSTNELVSELAERCRSCILGLNLAHEGAEKRAVLTASIGVSTLQPSRLMTAARIMDIAAQELRKAQEGGGNQYQAFAEGIQEPSLTYSV